MASMILLLSSGIENRFNIQYCIVRLTVTLYSTVRTCEINCPARLMLLLFHGTLVLYCKYNPKKIRRSQGVQYCTRVQYSTMSTVLSTGVFFGRKAVIIIMDFWGRPSYLLRKSAKAKFVNSSLRGNEFTKSSQMLLVTWIHHHHDWWSFRNK
jgi:hypothetical protein